MAGPSPGPGLCGRVHRRDRGQGPDGQVANRPVYAPIGVTRDGNKDIPGLWAGTGGEGAKFWPAVPEGDMTLTYMPVIIGELVLGRSGEQADGSLDQAHHKLLRRDARTDRRDGLLPAHAPGV